MSTIDFKERAERAKAKRRQELADQVKAGEKIDPLINVTSTWFPPRPIIKKDKDLISRLYDGDKE